MTSRFVTFFYVFITVKLLTCGLSSNVIQECERKCDTEVEFVNEGGTDLFCDRNCSLYHCRRGCSVYPSDVHTSCQSFCKGDYSQNASTPCLQSWNYDEVSNCYQGCMCAMGEYFNEIKRIYKKVGIARSPSSHTLGHSSLTLSWNGYIPDKVVYKVYKLLLDTNTDWRLHREAVFRPDGKIELSNLQPYVAYKFKIMIFVTSVPAHVIKFPDTGKITTRAHGVPSTAPRISSVSSPMSQAISVTWTPPTFSNGKLVRYSLYLQPGRLGDQNLTKLDLPWNTTSWVIGQLRSSQKYVVSLTAWNSQGEGPRSIVEVVTLGASDLITKEAPLLILASGNKIITVVINNSTQMESQSSRIIYEHPDKTVNIIDMSVHIRRRLILAADSTGSVSLISLNGNSTAFNRYPGVKDARAVSVDWLSDNLYVASQDKIYSCPLAKDQCAIVLQGLAEAAADVQVDPINGYFYYAIYGEGQGLYRIPLKAARQTGRQMPFQTSLTQPTAQLIIATSDFLSVMIDFNNIQLLVVNHTAGKVMVASLDGSSIKSLHEKAASPSFDKVSRIATFNQTFIWADNQKLHLDKFEPALQKYQHSELLLFKPPYTSLSLFHPGIQPLPAPSTAPDSITAVFARDHAVVSWNPPPLLHYQGQGAWKNWTYQLQLVKSGDKTNLLDKPQQFDISGLSLTITDLNPDSVYKVKIRARSDTGFGPWSEEFIGRTLKYDDMRILMSHSGGVILEKSVAGTVTSQAELNSDAIMIDWHGDIILWVGDSDVLFMYNRTTQQSQELTVVPSASCIAYDWLGHKVYWSNEMIHRSNLYEDRHELICQSEAVDIAIDAVNGRLYWATKFSVEMSYLNGNERQAMFALPIFSDRSIISLTLDLDSGKVVWCETSYNGHKIFMLDLLPLNGEGCFQTPPVEVRQLESAFSIPSLQYFSHSLFWLTEANTLATGNSYNNFSSIVSSDDLLCFKVTHPVMHSFPANMSASKIKVIPASIQPTDLHIEGVWSVFNLTWPKQTVVNYGAVFYKLFIEAVNNSKHLTTSNHFFEMSGFSPYTQLVVSIQPLSHWGYAEATTVSLRTPTSEPTAPLSPEVYVIQHKNATASHQTLAADFRWMTPKYPNGIITNHLVTYWKEGESRTVISLNGTARHFILTPLEKSQIYYFQVAACTEVGCGPESSTKISTTDASTPVPTLLVASKDDVSLTEMDSNLNFTSIISGISPKAATYLAKNELRMFWLDNNNTIYESSESAIHEIVSLSSKGEDVAVDWISHTLYIVESASFGGSTITQFNIDTKDYRVLLSRSAYVSSILVDPYNSIIIWTELTSTDQTQIMKADIRTGQAEGVLRNSGSRSRRSSDDQTCSCRLILNVAQAIAMSYKGYDDGITEIFFADKVTGAIYLTDLMGCQCLRIIQPTPSNSFGLPPSLMTVDHTRLSWYNKTEAKLYSVLKTTGDEMVVHNVGDVVDILAYGSHLQPLPDSQCLDPGPYSSSIDILNIANTSVSLALTAPVRPTACQGISSPVYKYTVYYRKVAGLKTGVTPDDCQNDLSLCHKQQSYNTRVKVANLEPYTQYLIQVAVSTYYTEYLAEALSKPVLLTTILGVPGLARAVNARPLTPEQIALSWAPPSDFHGPPENINYVVQLWKAVSLQGNIEKEIEVLPKMDNSEGEVAIEVTQLEPDHAYSIRILTCAGNRTLCSATEAVQCRTFKTPSAIALVNATADSLEIQWRSPPDNEVLRHQVTYAEMAPGPLNWTTGFPSETDSSTEYRELVTELKPNTLYTFKIMLNYHARPYNRALYFWPPDQTRFSYRTLVYHPNQPSAPTVTHLPLGDYEVKWDKPNDNGAPITNYILEYSNSMDKQTWKTVYNGSQEQWRVDASGMKHGASYVFRVTAVNSEGTGPTSEISSLFMAPLVMENNLSNHVTIGVVLGIIALLAVVILAIVFVLHKRQAKIKSQQFIIGGPDTELANLRELPYNTFQQSNTLYAINIQCTDEEIAKLPHFSRSQLVLTMFLGSGAFGEVFEGLAKNIRGNSDTKCAVKTLRKGASDHEKEEFLKEALLMKNFQHEHILSLLGVCLDNDPQFIIMELMEGGDLLSFLRSCRATLTTPAKLMLPDIVKICLHVSRGCKYLEDMHFVHRDLAARNCLVSTKSPADMTVKIGDFGLARDIYKNDYYRKEGEGLLPVRWMSPESLVDGFFTTQSDIWAFGVLMWEVATLGQQPYPARTNIEVLHFVRDRGKLERPDKCADEMYSLMSKCWSFHPSNRPCFASLVEDLENFQEKCKQMSEAEISQYSPTFIDVRSDVLESLSEEEEEDETEEEALTRGLFAPNSRTVTGGGSVRLTQSAKQKRLSDLLGSAERPEKLVVDLNKISRKRTHSLEDSKHSTKNIQFDVSNQDHFPAAGEYDHHGYLEPRGTKGGGRYLELMNYAPELFHLQDPYGNPLVAGSGSAFLPVHVTHKGYHPSNVSYTLLSPDEDIEDANCHRSPDFSTSKNGIEDRLYTQTPTGLVSVESPKARRDHHHTSIRTPEKQFQDYHHHHHSLLSPAATLGKSSPPRKFSDQDLYSSTDPYRQRPPSSASGYQDPRYASVECNNNRSSTSDGNVSNDQDSVSDSSGFMRNNHGFSSFHTYNKTGLEQPLSVNLPAAVEDESLKLSATREAWTNHLENNGMTSECSNDIVNHQGHGHHSSRSRGQVYPEKNSASLVGYGNSHVSLV